MSEPYSVDDRGNVAQFYDVDESVWDGDEHVTAWAVANGYPEVATMKRAE